MASFPKGWFFIKNFNNGYVLSTEKQTVGEPVIIASIKTRDFDSQLWQHGEDGRLHNKQTGFVLDIFKGLAKVGSEIVQQNDSDSSEGQTFGTSAEGHIFLVKNPKLVLGIKESFFTRREGQHIHLQEAERNIKGKKEQRWDFVLPSQKRFSASMNPMDSLKRTISGASLGSFSSSLIHAQHDEDSCLDESHSNSLTSFPDTEFFIKSDSTGYFIGIEANAINSPGGHLSLEPLRKNNYESQLWHYDVISGRLINKNSGFTLSVEDLSDESSVFQSSSSTEKDLAYQSWSLTASGEIKLKNDQKWVLGFKKDSWFGLNREGVSVLLQKQTESKTHPNQRFIIVMPVFKKKTTEIVTVSEQQGVFPEDYFFIKNQKHGLVITVLETEKLAAQVFACQLDIENYNRQLWKFKDGFLINKASDLVLDIRGGCIVSGSEICQYKQKNEGSQNQQWGLSIEGYIHAKTHTDVVLAISGNKKTQYSVHLFKKKTPDHEEQRWNFVLPVFKQKSTTVAHTTVQKSVSYHHYAQYPSGWFFIRSFTNGSSTAAPLVLTADSASHHVSLLKISKEEWRNQLWMYWNGVLINFATQLAIDVDSVNVGSTICQELRKAGSVSQRWNLTIEGYLVHGFNPSLILAPSLISESKYKLALTDHISAEQSHRWGILAPEIKVENNTQFLVRWSIIFLIEWKKFSEQHVQKVVHSIANWPDDTFFITAQAGLALIPEKSEAFSFLVVKKFEYAQSEHFKWTYRNGVVVHVATGLVLHASDDLVGGSQLQIREELFSDSKSIDQRQKWVIKTDGSIISELKTNLGFSLIQEGNLYLVQLAYISNTSEHYNWGFLHGHYESRYSEIYKKEVNVITHTERILLTVRTQQTSSNANTKLVTHSFGIFPENWFYIRSKQDKSLVLTAPSRKQGTKLTLSKIDYTIFRRQLWHVQDDGCLVNLESNLVIDVAGGAFNIGSDIIQWHEKYLRRHRKNQVWALSVDGHLHPKARPGLVLGVKGNKAVDGAEIQLHHRGSLDLGYQLWTFATPVFGRTTAGVTGVSAAGVLDQNDDTVFIKSVDEAEFHTSAIDRFERTSKLTVVRRWGLFPEGSFFIRSSFGDEHLTLTVEKKPRIGENGRTEYEVALRPINFQEYQWHFWVYQEGHLINAQTGLALDATLTKGVLVEDGLRNPLFVRDKSMTENQFWSLTADGEIFLRSDQRLVIGVSNSRRVSVPGAQVGLRQLRVRTYMNDQNQQETSLKSEKWLRWLFSKPVYHRKTTTSATSSASTNVIEDSSNEIIEDVVDQELGVKQKEESADDYSVDEDDSYSSNDEDDEGDNDKKPNLIGNLGSAVTGASIVAGVGMISNVITSAPETISTEIIGKKDTSTHMITKKTSYHSLKYDRKDSFHVQADYVPTGFENIVRYTTYQLSNFPTAGYFMIKSCLHGLVLDVVDGETKDGAYVVLSPIKSKDFASQLWFFKDGRVVNLKGHNLVLDASMTDTIIAGERLVISTKKSSLSLSDQYWEYSNESGLICLNSKRNIVLGVKELKRVTDQSITVDVYIQEEKSHRRTAFGRPEQRWEIKIPAFIPVEQTTNANAESKYTIIQGGKIDAISSSLSAIIAFDGLKKTFHHKITAKNQWPNAQNWFFIRVGNENAFLSSGSTDSSEVKLVSLGQKEDYKQFLWVYVNGYLVNYKYMLRLVYNNKSNKLALSSSTDTIGQVFFISSKGNLSVKLQSETTYFSISSSYGSYDLKTSCTEDEYSYAGHSLQLHIPKFSDVEIEKRTKIALSTVTSWIQSSQVTTTTLTSVTKSYGVFPSGTWFFIKANTSSGDSLVLAVRDASFKSGASLVLNKLSFKDYRSQLWTFRDGLLINYGSKLVIDVNGGISESSKLIQSAEDGTSSQKWSLTTTGCIQLDSYAQYYFGYTMGDMLCDGLEIVLVTAKETYEESSKIQSITWRFSVPVFGKAAITSTGSENTSKTTENSVKSSISAIERLTDSIEHGALIEAVEDADIKVEDITFKKNNAINNTALTSTSLVEKEKQHAFQNILTNVGIAVTTGGVVKIADRISEHKEGVNTSNTPSAAKTQEQKQPSSASKVNQGAITDVNKVMETIIVRRSQRTSVQLIKESLVIVRAWKIVFSQRVHHCKTKAELIQTIEECREELFRRLDEHLRVYASIEHLIAGAVPEWHVSILQVKELYRARVFENFLDLLHSEEVIDITDINFDSILESAAQEIDTHYQLVINTQNKILSEASTSSNTVTTSKCSEEVSVQENILVTIDTIKVTVRYWLIALYETISIAKSNGSSNEKIKMLIENSRKELSKEFTKIKKFTTTYIQNSSSTILTSKQTSICNTIANAIAQTESVISNEISAICSEKQYLDSEDHWLNVTRITEERLSGQLKVYQTAITQEIAEVQKNEISATDKAEITVVLDEKMVAVAQQTVANKLVETQTKISSWFIEITQQISSLLEGSKTSDTLQKTVKQDIIAIADAAQIEINSRIAETKLVIRAYYAHLTYLSWAERRRIEYSLDNINASVIASIVHFKQSIEKNEINKEQIIQYSNYSFSASFSRIVLTDLQSIIVKVTDIKETATIVNKTEEVKAEKTKIAIIGESSSTTNHVTEIKKTTTDKIDIGKSKTDETIKKTQEAKVNAGKQTKISDHVELEVEQTKIGKVDTNKQSTSAPVTETNHPSSATDKHTAAVVSTAVLSAAAAAMASAAMSHHKEGKKIVQQDGSSTNTSKVQKPVPTSAAVGKTSEVSHTDKENNSVAKQEESKTSMVVYNQLQIFVRDWMIALNKRVYEYASKKSNNAKQEIDTIVFDSQQQLLVEIEKVKRNTTAVTGTFQNSLFDTLPWVKSTLWKHAFEVKHIGYEIATLTETSKSYYQEKLESLTKTTIQEMDVAIEKLKTSSSVITVVDNQPSATVVAGKKFEGVDYSKTSYDASIEKTKVIVGILIEDTRVSIQTTISNLTASIIQRRKEGGENVQADIDIVIKKHREEINSYILKSKTEFEKRMTSVHQSSSTIKVSKIDVELTNQTITQVQTTLDQFQETVMVQITKVEQVTSAMIVTSEVGYEEKLASISYEACKKLDATLTFSESIIGHHVEVAAESSALLQSISIAETKGSSSKTCISLGVEYGLIIIAETTKNTSSQISALVERVHHRLTIGSENLEVDIKGLIVTCNKELDLIFEQAKIKISYELSMIASHEKVDEKHFFATLEAIRSSAKTRITEIQTVATSHMEESTVFSKKLLQITGASRNEVIKYYESIKQTVTNETEKVSESVLGVIANEATGPSQKVTSHTEEQKKQNEDKSSVDLAKKVLIGSAAVAAGAAIAVHVSKKLKEQKEKNEKVEQTKNQTTIVIEDVKVQLQKWISSLTEAVTSQSNQSKISTEEISLTIEKSKTEFLEVIKKAKSNKVLAEKHQQQILSWIEQTAISQATRIEEIAVYSSSSAAVHVESRLEVIKISTTQEIEAALEQCKHQKYGSTEYVGVTVEQLKLKEAALLDIRSELVIVIQDVRSSLVTFFQKFTRTVIARIEQGGDNTEKDVALLIANTRKELSMYIESIKSTATKRLSALETKSSTSIISNAALSGIATAEIINVLNSSEEIILQKVNHVHSNTWYMKTSQDTSKVVQAIIAIESETIMDITESVESSKYGFATAINEHHKAGHLCTDISKHTQTSEHASVVLKASLSVQEIKVTVREWFRSLSEAVSVCSQKGGSAEEIDLIIKHQNAIIVEYLDQSRTHISETVKSEEEIKYLHTTFEKVKMIVSKTSTEIKVIGVEHSSSTSYGYGGFDKMTSVITQHEHEVSEVLVSYESKISKKLTEEKKQESSSKIDKKSSSVLPKNTYTVVAVEYIISTVHTWLQELMTEVSECAKHEHNITIVTKEMDAIMANYKEYISIEFEMITKGIRTSSAATANKQELINILEWTRGMVLQISSQIQSIGINCAVAFSATGGIEQMKPLVNATESQISVAVGRFNKTIMINVERNSVHQEKKKTKSECAKQGTEKKAQSIAAKKKKKESECAKKDKKSKNPSINFSSDSDTDSNSDSESDDDKKSKEACKRIDKVKKSKKSEAKKSKKSKKSEVKKNSSDDSSDESDSEKKTYSVDKKKIAAGIIAGTIIKSKIDHSGSSDSDLADSSDSDSDTDTYSNNKKASTIEGKRLNTDHSTLDVTIIVNEWYTKLIVDVSTRAQKGGSSVNADIESIVQKATKRITETLRIVTINAHKFLIDATTVKQYQASIQWTNNLIIQSSHQIKAIGFNSAASFSKTGGIEQMRPIVTSIQQQIHVEILRYKLTAVKTEKAEKSTEKFEKTETAIDAVEHKKNNDTICTGRKSAINRKEYCEKLDQHISEIVAETKVVIVSWLAQLVRDASICIHQGGSNIGQDITAIIEKSKYELDSTIRRTQNKLSSSIEIYHEDKTFAMIQYQIEQCLKTVKTTVESKIDEIQDISTNCVSQNEVTEKLHAVLEKSKANITDTLESGYKESVAVIKNEITQTESTVTIIDTVDTVKTTVIRLHTKLIEDIHCISIDTSINNKEERIKILIEQVNTEIYRVTTESKTKVSYECQAVKKINRTKEQALLNTIDYVYKSFTTDSKKIQQISIEAIQKSNNNMKERINSVTKCSHEKIDSALTKTTATVVGAATAIAVHSIQKKNKQEEKKSQKNKLSVDVEENALVLSQWFELFTLKISGFVQKSNGDVVQNVTDATEQAEQEITEIITTARNDFVQRLTLQNLDQESFNYACKHYEESLELVRVTIITEIVEVRKIAIHAHASGSIQEIETKFIKSNKTLNKRIKVAMGSSVIITENVHQGTSNQSEPILQIEVQDDDAIVIGEEEIDYDRKEETTITTHQEKTKIDKDDEKKKTHDMEKIVAGSLAIGASSAGAAYINHNNKEKTETVEKQKKQDVLTAHQKLKYDSGIASIESVDIAISTWFTSLIQKVSAASKSGNASKITMIVKDFHAELTEIIEHTKTEGSKFCASANDEQQFISKIDWVASVAHNQAVQIQQIGINAASRKTDMTSQMEAIATASYYQIEVTLQQMKTSVKFHQKINKINSNKTKVDHISTQTSVSEKILCGKMDNTIEKTKLVYSVLQESRITTISIFVSLTQRIVHRIRQAGSNVQEDISKMISTSEKEITKLFNEAKVNSANNDKKTQLEMEHALTIVYKTVQEQMTELKNLTNEAVSTNHTDSKVAIEKVLDASKSSLNKIETTYTSMSQKVLTSLTVVTQTGQQATETVQDWFIDVTSKISKLLEANDCSEEETQSKIDTVVADAEIEMKTKIEKLQETSVFAITKKTSKTTEITTDHHLEIFFGNVKSSTQNQLNVLKTAVKDSSKTDKSKILSTLETTETNLQQELKTHYEAIENITTVEHITGKSEQKVAAEVEKNRHDSYKNTIEKTALGAATLAAAAAVAIGYHNKSQQSQTTTVQVVKESSLKDVQFKIDTWFAKLTEKITTCTKKGGSNVSVEVAKIVQEAQSELEVTINEAKSQYKPTQTTTCSSVESHRTFVSTLEWIKITVQSQSAQITQIISHGSSSSVDLASQIENHICATKHQIDSALEVHCKNETSTIVADDQSKKTQGEHTKKQTVQNVVDIVKETPKQTQERFKLETTVIVQESKTEITNWLVLLLESISDMIHGNSKTIRKDIFAKLEVAHKEIDVFVKQTKDKFITTSKTTATSHVETQTQTLVVNSVKQTLDCIDSIRATVFIQISLIREVITRIDVEDIDIITRRLEAIITRTQKRVHHTLEVGIDLGISAAFEGKVVTWSETCVIPTAFTNVRAIAFDILGTVANYRKTLETVWTKIVTPKNNVVLSALEFNTFVGDWYGAYTEIKTQNFNQKRPVSDDISLHEALIHILRRYYIKDLLSESEIEELCDAWRNVGIHGDVITGIRRLKNQASTKYATVAVSDTLSTRSMVELAQNNCLCWHAQFTADMFSTQNSSTVSCSQSVIRGTIELLGLERANQLAIVSSNAEMVAAAKEQGCFAILVERDEQCIQQTTHNETTSTTEFDIKVDGIDIFGESVQSFLEHESMVEVWNKKNPPAAPRVWVQQLKGSSA